MPPAPQILAGRGLPALTGARFLAAFAVVVYHYGRGSLRGLSPLLATLAAVGPAAVSFFYVLSGAVLTWGCTDDRSLPSRPARTFWIQRAARILPAYLLALVLSIPPFALHAAAVYPAAGAAVRVVSGVVACALLLQAFWPPLTAGLNTPGWSISCEGFFYVLWPRLATALRSGRPGFPWRRGLWLWAAGLVAPALGLWALRQGFPPSGPFPTLLQDESGSELLVRLLSYFPPLRLPEFALGIALGHALRNTPVRDRSVAADSAREVILVSALVASAWALGSGLPSRLTGIALADRVAIEGGALAPLFALLTWQLARGDGLLRRQLSLPSLVSLGEASYALYILQEPVLVWTTGFLKRSAPALMAKWDSLFWVYAGLLVICSLLLHHFVEAPLREQLSSRLRSRP